jgi:hypothetical protein
MTRPSDGTSNSLVQVTFFTNHAARTKREKAYELADLAALIQRTSAPTKARLPWLKLARFGDTPGPGGSLRHDRNVIACTGCEIDYDAGVMSFDEAGRRLQKAGIQAILCTSPSHTPDFPRWRVLCPFSQELPPEQRAVMVARVNGVLGGAAAVESFTISQSYYYGSVADNPHHKTTLIPGTPVDPRTELDAAAMGKARGGAAGFGGRDGPVDEAALRDAIRSSKAFHNAALTLVGRWAQQGVTRTISEQRLAALFDAVPVAQRDGRWEARRRELPRTLDYVYTREAAKSAPGPDGAEVIDLGLLKAEVPKLAKLGAPEYEATRKAAAARIRIATTRLDGLVKKERATTAADGDVSGQAMAFPRDVPWPDEVELTDLLDAIDAVLQETMVMTDAQRLGFGLWVVFTHCLDAFDNSPRLIIRSPLKRSGKTKLLRSARILVARGIAVVSLSASSLFRSIERLRPTILLDEADNYLTDVRKGAGAELNLALQALINGGFDRDDSYVIRVEGERTREPRLFSTWCALCLARIGVAASTIEDRSVVIVLARKATTEKVARLDRPLRARLGELRRQIARWAVDNINVLGQAEPELPELGSDRAADCWRPLVAIADRGGAGLGAQARAAALALTVEAETQEIELQALSDIAPYLTDHPQLTELFTSELVAHLHTLEHRPWPEYGRKQQPISQSQLARLLARIGLVSTPVWRGKVSARGYKRDVLEGVIGRYFPSPAAPETSERRKP